MTYRHMYTVDPSIRTPLALEHDWQSVLILGVQGCLVGARRCEVSSSQAALIGGVSLCPTLSDFQAWFLV